MFYYTGTGTQFQAENDWILNEFSIPYAFLYDFFNHMLFWCGMMLLNSDANEHRHALRADLLQRTPPRFTCRFIVMKLPPVRQNERKL